MENNYYTICYFSDETTSLNKNDMEALFNQSSSFNNANNIYGIFLHIAGKYLQILEGNKAVIDPLYARIVEDSRHKNIYEVFNKKTDNLIFKKYNSKFSIVKTTDDLDDINNYLESNRYDSRCDKLSRLLAPFLMFREA
ncbi:BLUF domain-containing protein [Nonlabens ulvanivorans]|uniref:BLUF domain-containing protein n=1 Tax=Nonlabens ulvanivorans TaxID=906888 RepID=UPI0037C78050